MLLVSQGTEFVAEDAESYPVVASKKRANRSGLRRSSFGPPVGPSRVAIAAGHNGTEAGSPETNCLAPHGQPQIQMRWGGGEQYEAEEGFALWVKRRIGFDRAQRV